MKDRPNAAGDSSLIELIDEEGNSVYFEPLLTYDMEDRKYIALHPQDGQEDDVAIFRIETDENGQDTYVVPQDQRELEMALEELIYIIEECEGGQVESLGD